MGCRKTYVHLLRVARFWYKFFFLLRVFGRLVLIPFREGRRSPDGIDAQQIAEANAEEIFNRASSAVGVLVSVSQSLEFLCKERHMELSKKISTDLPFMDDRCIKNYALHIALAEKVRNTTQKVWVLSLLETIKQNSKFRANALRLTVSINDIPTN